MEGMKLRALAILLLILGSALPSAHAETPKLWIEGAEPGRLQPDRMTDGKRSISPGAFGFYDVRELVGDGTAAEPHLLRAEKYQRRTHLVYWLGTVPSMVVTVVGFTRDSGGTAMRLGGLGGVALFSYLSLKVSGEARRSMWDAVNTINGVKPAPNPEKAEAPAESDRADTLHWGAMPTLDGGALALGWSF